MVKETATGALAFMGNQQLTLPSLHECHRGGEIQKEELCTVKIEVRGQKNAPAGIGRIKIPPSKTPYVHKNE